MQYFVAFSDDGNISGFYYDEIHGSSIPETAAPITVDQWKTYCAAPNLYKRSESGDEPCRLKTQAELDADAASQPKATPNPIDDLKLQNAELLFKLAQAQDDLNQKNTQMGMMLMQLATIQGGP